MLPANLTLILLAATAACGQSADPPTPTFDVASVKASQPGADGGQRGRGNTQVSPGSVTMRNVSLKTAIRWAWHVSEFQVSGPDWLDSQRYVRGTEVSRAAPSLTGIDPSAHTRADRRLWRKW